MKASVSTSWLVAARLVVFFAFSSMAPFFSAGKLQAQDPAGDAPLIPAAREGEVSLDRIGQWCNSMNMRFSYSKDKKQLIVNNVGRHKLRMIAMFDSKRQMLLWLVPVITEPNADWETLARAANRLNLGISSGAFVAREDRAVVFRMGIPTRGTKVDDAGLKYHFDLALGTVNTCFEALQKVDAGTLEPEAVFSARQK